MIVHLVRLNKQRCFYPPRFSLPSVEDLAFLLQAHNMGLSRLSLGGSCLHQLIDPLLRGFHELCLLASRAGPLLACHIDLTSAFWSLTLPKPCKNSFRVRTDVLRYLFSCLLFGRLFSPDICQHVLAFLTNSLDTSGVIVLHHLDDSLVRVYGRSTVGSGAHNLCKALRQAAAVISSKSVFDPVPEIQWLGKWPVLSRNGAQVFSEGQGGLPCRAFGFVQPSCPLYASTHAVLWGG